MSVSSLPPTPSTPSRDGHDSDSEEWLYPRTEVGKCVVVVAATGEVLCEFVVDLMMTVGFAASVVQDALLRRRDARSSSRARLLHGTRELKNMYGKLHELEFDGANILSLQVVFEDAQLIRG